MLEIDQIMVAEGSTSSHENEVSFETLSDGGGGFNPDSYPTSDTNTVDADLFITKESGGWVRKAASKVWNYIKGKADSVYGKKTEAIKNITRSGTTFTATRCDGTTFTFTQQDNNTTYSLSADGANVKLTPSSGSASTANLNNLINGLTTGDSTPQDADYVITQYVGGGTTTTTYHRRPISKIWDYIKGKIGISSGSTYLKKDGTWGTPTNTIPSAICDTVATEAAKVASCTSYKLQEKTHIQVILNHGNTVQGAITLNINGTGDKPIYINGSASSSSNYTLPHGSYFVYYNGTNFYFRTDGRVNLSFVTGRPNLWLITGSGTAAQDKGEGVSPRYFPAKWTFNSTYTAQNGDIIVIKIPVAGHSNGVFMSIDNGTKYYPIVTNGASRLTTHFPNGTYIMLQLDTSASANDMYALNGADSRATVTGGAWRVVNYYDSGNTNNATRQYPTSTNADYRVLFSYNANDTDETNLTRKDADFKYNPSTNTLNVPKIGEHTLVGRLKTQYPINSILSAGTATAGQDKGSSANPRYFPAKWTMIGYANPSVGDILFIKVPGAGHDYGVWLSVNNGTSYNPVVLNGTTRLTTHFAADTCIAVQYQDGTANNIFNVNGGNSRVNFTGQVWRVINFYDTNTNTTYTFATGDNAGQIKVTPSDGSASNINVKSIVKHLGNAGKSNMNDIGRLYPSIGMTNLSDPSNETDNPMDGSTKSTSWHLYFDASYSDDPNGSNAWVAQIVNRAGTDRWYVRSRKGGTITNGTAWDSTWRHLVTSYKDARGSASKPVYVNENGEVIACDTSLTDYLLKTGGTVSGTLILSRTTDASGTANNKPALIVGGTDTQAHLELDANEVMAKASGTTTAPLYLNNEGGLVYANAKKVARLTADPVSGRLLIADGTDGQIKDSGRTINSFPYKFYSSWTYNVVITSSTESGQIIWLFTPNGYITIQTSGKTIYLATRHVTNISKWTYVVDSTNKLKITLNCTDHTPMFIFASDNAISVTFTDTSTPQANTMSNNSMPMNISGSAAKLSVGDWQNGIVNTQNATYYKKVGNIVYVHVNYSGSITGQSWYNYFTLPSGYRPSKQVDNAYATGALAQYSGLIRVATNGQVSLFSSGTAGAAIVFGWGEISFIADGS